MSCAENSGGNAPFQNSENGHGGNINVAENNGDIKEIITRGQGQPQEKLPCTWERELSKEVASYKNLAEGAYCPRPLDDAQLRKAALEFYKRWKESEEAFDKQHLTETEKSPFVLVSHNCSKIPSDGMTRSALQGLDAVDKLWYFLSDKGDLFVIKLASGPAHGAAVSEVFADVVNFGRQFKNEGKKAFNVISDGKIRLWGGGRNAPDAVLQRRDGVPSVPPSLPLLHSPLVVEIEVGNRRPKALMLQLDLYLQQPQPHTMYVLGIKIYKKQRLPPNHPIPAIAILWRRSKNMGRHTCEGVWNFGSMNLNPMTIASFCRAHGNLTPPTPIDFQYPPNNTTVTIPANNLIQGVCYENGAPVQALPNGNNLTINLSNILDSVEIYL